VLIEAAVALGLALVFETSGRAALRDPLRHSRHRPIGQLPTG
jgi:hypothetical protein